MIKRLAPLFSLLLALSCGSPTAVIDPFEPGEPFWLPFGAQAVSVDGSAVVRFARVVSDSRCAGGEIVCVWEGEAFVEIGVQVPPAAETLVQLKVYPLGPLDDPAPVQGRWVSVLDLTPVAMAQRPDVPRVRLQVSAVP